MNNQIKYSVCRFCLCLVGIRFCNKDIDINLNLLIRIRTFSVRCSGSLFFINKYNIYFHMDFPATILAAN